MRDERYRLMALLACTVPAVLYLATLQFDFVYDDTSQIVSNPLIQTWKSLPLIFTTDVWRFQNPLVVGNYWRPIFMLWLLLNHSLFGFHAAAWHAMAVLLHVACTYLVFRLVLRISGDQWLALFAALLFSVHPTHMETVAWVSGATDSLMCIFLLGSLLAFVTATERQGRRRLLWIALSVLLYAAALLTKETAIVGFAFIGAHALLFSDSHRTGTPRVFAAIVATIPFGLALLLYLLLRRAALMGFSHPLLVMPWIDVLLTVPSILFFYLAHLVWPLRLSVFYDSAPVIHLTWSNFWQPLLACMVVATLLGVYIVRTRDRLAAFATVLMVLPIVPVLYIPALEVDSFLHDRYLYVPSIGFAILVAIALRKIDFGPTRVFSLPAAQALATVVLVLGLAIATATQEIYWANDLLLFDRAASIAPGNATAFSNLGQALAARGLRKQALNAFQQSLLRNPGNWAAQYSVGLIYFLDGKYADSEVRLQKAIELHPAEGDPAALLAEARIRQGKFADAEIAIRYAISVKPYKPGFRRVLALTLEGQGKFQEAIAAAQTELDRYPQDEETKSVLDRLRKEAGQSGGLLPLSRTREFSARVAV